MSKERFYLLDTEVFSWNYNDYEEELMFYNENNSLIATINYSQKEYKKLNKMSDHNKWNELAKLFGDE